MYTEIKGNPNPTQSDHPVCDFQTPYVEISRLILKTMLSKTIFFYINSFLGMMPIMCSLLRRRQCGGRGLRLSTYGGPDEHEPTVRLRLEQVWPIGTGAYGIELFSR